MQQGWHVTVLPFIMILTEKGRDAGFLDTDDFSNHQ